MNLNSLLFFLNHGFAKITNHDAVLGSTYTHHIYRNQLSRNEGATLAINSSTLDKLLKQSSNGNVFVVFSCLDRFGKKQVGLFRIAPETIKTAYGFETSSPYFRSAVTGNLIIRVGGYDWSLLSRSVMSERNYWELYQAA